VSGQPDIGCEHEPKGVITYKWNIDKHRNEREEGNNERNDVHAENVEDPNRCNSHIASLLKARARKSLRVSEKSQSKTDN
jgi:hypothetical protein